MEQTLHVIVLWRDGEDFPEIYDAWDRLTLEYDSPQGFEAKKKEAEKLGDVRVMHLKYEKDLIELFYPDEMGAEVVE